MKSNKPSRKTNWKRFVSWFSSLKQSERILVSVTAAMLFGYGLSVPISTLQESISETGRLITFRKKDLEDVNYYLKRYSQFDLKLKGIHTTFDKIQITFDQVYGEVDRIAKESLGEKGNYDLTKSRDPEQLGDDYEKQDFQLVVKSVTLEQLVKLLYELEQGETPLFLGKVDISSSQKKGMFKATLVLTSLGKRSRAGSKVTT